MEKFNYSNLREILSAHLQKENKVDVYQSRVDANLINQKATFQVTWSWWGFFGGWAFFLYRKMYLVAAIFFVLSLLTASIPFGGLILAIITGTTAFYFYTKKLTNDLESVDYKNRDIQEVTHDLRKLGGYNSWVVIVAVIYYALMFIFFLPITLALFTASIVS